MDATIDECLPQSILERLFSVLKKWSSEGMDAFRYEMFAKRLVAAEYGRPDAVQWARDWHADLVKEEKAAEEQRVSDRTLHQQQRDHDRAEFLAGRCANPNYQAFLDTIEDPASIQNHVEYMAWIGRLSGLFEAKKRKLDLSQSEGEVLWKQMLKEERDANLAPRLRKLQGDSVQ